MFLESSNGEVSFQIWKSGTLIAKVPQSEWNQDKMDSTGRSGITIDWNTGNIFQGDYEWLGVGRVRGTFVINGNIYSFHHFNNANNLPKVYMSSPNQPFRWEIRQSGNTTGSFEYICSTFGTEGSVNTLGKILSVNDDGNKLVANNTNSRYACVGLRLKESAVSSFIDIVTFSLLGTTNDSFLWEIRLNPVVGGNPTWDMVGAYSSMEYSMGSANNTVTGGILLYSGYQYQLTGQNYELENALKLGATITGVRDELFLCVKPLSVGLDVYRSFTWREQI